MAAKIRYSVRYRGELVGTRQSHRTYTHAVVSPAHVHPEGATRGEYDHHTERPEGEGWTRSGPAASWYRVASCAGEPVPASVVAYCGRPDLAAKKLAECERTSREYLDRATSCVIVPVEVA